MKEISFNKDNSISFEDSKLHSSKSMQVVSELQIYKELSFYQPVSNPKKFIVNRTQTDRVEKTPKDTLPVTPFSEAFTLKNSVLICTIESTSLFICKRNIYSTGRSGSTADASEYQYILKFPANIVKSLFCIEAAPNQPILLVITVVGNIYILNPNIIDPASEDNELNLPSLTANINLSLVASAVEVKDPVLQQQNQGFPICLSCTDGQLYFIKLFFSYDYEQVYNNKILPLFNFRIDCGLLKSVVKRDYLIDMCYITHKIVVGITASNVLKVFNLHQKACILSHQLRAHNTEKDFYRVKAIASNPYTEKRKNQGHSFLVCVYVANSVYHTEVKQFDLSFSKAEKIITANDPDGLHCDLDLGTTAELTEIADFTVGDMITHMDLNNTGILVTAFSYERIEDRIVYHRFEKEIPENLVGFESVFDEVLTQTEKRKKLFNSNISPQEQIENLLTHSGILSTELVYHFLNEKFPNTYKKDPTVPQIYLREHLFSSLRNQYSTSESNNDSELKNLMTELHDFLKKNDLIEAAILPANSDFMPLILRSTDINVLVGSTTAESFEYAISKYSNRVEDSEEIFQLVDTFGSSLTLNFLSMLMVLRKSLGDLQSPISDYIKMHKGQYEFKLSFATYLQKNALPQFELKDQIVLRKILALFSNFGVLLDPLINQFIAEIKENLTGGKSQKGSNTIENEVTWGSSIVYLLGQSLREFVDHALELTSFLILLTKFITNAYHPAQGGLEIEAETVILLKDLAQVLVGLKLLSQTSITSSAIDQLVSGSQTQYSFIDQITYFTLCEHRKYLPPLFEYSANEAFNWFFKTYKLLLNAIYFEAFSTDIKNVPHLFQFLVDMEQNQSLVELSNFIEYKNPTYQYMRARALSDPTQNKNEMIKSLMYVAAFINRLSNKAHELNWSLYEAVWYRSERFGDISRNVIKNYASPLVNFIFIMLKNSLREQPKAKVSLCYFGLSLLNSSEGTKINFAREIVKAMLPSSEFSEAYNLLYLLPEASAEFGSSVKDLFHVMSENDQIYKFSKFPFGSQLFAKVSHSIEEVSISKLQKLQESSPTIANSDELYSGIENSLRSYHAALSFYLEREMFNNAGSFAVQFYERLTELFEIKKEFFSPEHFLKLLEKQKNILIESIHCLDASGARYGLLAHNSAKTRVKRPQDDVKAEIERVLKSPTKTPSTEADDEEKALPDLMIDGLNLVDREKLNQHLQLIEARLTLQGKLKLQFKENTYESKSLISRLLITLGEYNQAFSFLRAFPEVFNDIIIALIVKFIVKSDEYPDATEEKLMLLIEKCLRVVKIEKISEAIKFTADSLFKTLDQGPFELPKFLLDLFWKHNPSLLFDLYVNHNQIERAVYALDQILRRNQTALKNSGAAKEAYIYVDPIVTAQLLEICNRESNKRKTDGDSNEDTNEETPDYELLKKYLYSKFKL